MQKSNSIGDTLSKESFQEKCTYVNEQYNPITKIKPGHGDATHILSLTVLFLSASISSTKRGNKQITEGRCI